MDYMSDIVIIGAGAVGTAIAREFSKYQVRVMVVIYFRRFTGMRLKTMCMMWNIYPLSRSVRWSQRSRRMYWAAFTFPGTR